MNQKLSARQTRKYTELEQESSRQQLLRLEREAEKTKYDYLLTSSGDGAESTSSESSGGYSNSSESKGHGDGSKKGNKNASFAYFRFITLNKLNLERPNISTAAAKRIVKQRWDELPTEAKWKIEFDLLYRHKQRLETNAAGRLIQAEKKALEDIYSSLSSSCSCSSSLHASSHTCSSCKTGASACCGGAKPKKAWISGTTTKTCEERRKRRERIKTNARGKAAPDRFARAHAHLGGKEEKGDGCASEDDHLNSVESNNNDDEKFYAFDSAVFKFYRAQTLSECAAKCKSLKAAQAMVRKKWRTLSEEKKWDLSAQLKTKSKQHGSKPAKIISNAPVRSNTQPRSSHKSASRLSSYAGSSSSSSNSYDDGVHMFRKKLNAGLANLDLDVSGFRRADHLRYSDAEQQRLYSLNRKRNRARKNSFWLRPALMGK